MLTVKYDTAAKRVEEINNRMRAILLSPTIEHIPEMLDLHFELARLEIALRDYPNHPTTD